MKILVAGATGNTGLRLVNTLVSQGHSPVALVRESSDTSGLPNGAGQRMGDLAVLHDGVCDGCEAVIFAAASGARDTDADMTDRNNHDGTISVIDHAGKAGVPRFVMLSSVGADDPDPTPASGIICKPNTTLMNT
ncbi:MAG: NAD(P)H-binding protein [Pseudomonadota bacterium]